MAAIPATRHALAALPGDVDELPPPMHVSWLCVCDTTLEFTPSGLRITPYHLPWLYIWSAPPPTQFWSWDSIDKVNIHRHCITSTLVLTRNQADGTFTDCPVRIEGTAWQLNRLASRIRKLINHGEHAEFDPAVERKLGRCLNWDVSYNATGMTVTQEHPLCCFTGVKTFVPWKNVVSIQRNDGLVTSRIDIRTVIEKKDKKNKTPPETKSADIEAVTYKVRGFRRDMHDVFTQMVRLTTPENFVLEPPRQIVPDHVAKVVEGGLIVYGEGWSCVCHTTTTYVPWRSVNRLEYVGGCCGFACQGFEFSGMRFWGGSIMISDRSGAVTQMEGCRLEHYEAVNKYCTQVRTHFQGDVAPTIVRDGVKISAYGVEYPVPTIFNLGGWQPYLNCMSSKWEFYPWEDLDAVEMKLGWLGASVHVVSEAGHKVRISLRWFRKDKAKAIMKEILKRKYRGKDLENQVVFAAPKGHQNACVLTDVNIMLVGTDNMWRRFVAVVDLDSVSECRVVTSTCFGINYLMVCLNDAMGEALHVDDALKETEDWWACGPCSPWRQVMHQCPGNWITVRLCAADDPNKLRAEIMQRARERKYAEEHGLP